MKECELCEEIARIHCGPDQASLCWDCDAKVHSANFLVARHLRSLLCYFCQSPMPWSATGSSLRPTVAVCQLCFYGGMYKKRIPAVPQSPPQPASEISSIAPGESLDYDEVAVTDGPSDDENDSSSFLTMGAAPSYWEEEGRTKPVAKDPNNHPCPVSVLDMGEEVGPGHEKLE